MLAKYGQIIADQEKRGFIERAGEDIPADRKVHYIPHHPVKKDSTTTPIRIVYDCSCRESSLLASLNDCLSNEPPEINDIVGILLRFRQNVFAVTTDIEKAFLNVGLEESDRDATRFFWYRDPMDQSGPLVTYRFKSVLFRATCSPFILSAVILKHLKDNPSKWTDTLINNLYVDNIINSFQTEQQVTEYYNHTRTLFAQAGFNLRSWASNSGTLEHLAKQDNVLDTDGTVKVLGMKWNVESDTLTFTHQNEVNMTDKIITKRDVLRASSRIYDPLGLIGPITVRNKIFMQELWKHGMHWDEQLSTKHALQWTEIADNNRKATYLEITRLYTNGNLGYSNATLHIFTDASSKAYGACAYVVIGDQSTLIMAKNKVAPLKKVTIPKLELMGAVIGARLLKYIMENVSNISNAILWTDSQIVLTWLSTSKPLSAFIRNRVQEITEVTQKYSWRYCPTTSNPADLLSRGVDVEKLTKTDLWFKGPTWISNKELWPVWTVNESQILATVANNDDEKQHITDGETQRETNIEVNISNIMDITRFRSYRRLLHVTAYVIRFVKNCRHNRRCNIPLTVNELSDSALMWTRDLQTKHYSEIISDLRTSGNSKHCLSKQLKFYLDEDSVIRSKGRLQNAPISDAAKYPILLPKNDTLTDLIIKDAHERSLHSGENCVIS